MAKALTKDELRRELDELWALSKARLIGYMQGKEYQMSEPREPRFEDDFDCDEEPQEIEMVSEHELTLYGIASTKAHAYAQEYNPSTGKVEDRHFYHALREGYTAGFLEGFAHRLTDTTGE
jgi:hypothetical protein